MGGLGVSVLSLLSVSLEALLFRFVVRERPDYGLLQLLYNT